MRHQHAAYSLHDDRHIHVAVVRAAKVVADRHERARHFWSDDDFGRLTGWNFFIELERAQEETVGDVLAVNAQFDGLAFLQRDLVGAEGEALGRDFNDGDGIGMDTVRACPQQRQC